MSDSVKKKHCGNDEHYELVGHVCSLHGVCRAALGDWTPNGLEMSRPAIQGQYRAETDTWLARSVEDPRSKEDRGPSRC
jgi:hypothetical protein